MSTPPSGTVTFLFTDIEGSTRLARRNAAAWEATRARHHAILQAAIDAHRGHVFQVSGDAFCAAFANAPDAASAALEAQQKLQKLTADGRPQMVDEARSSEDNQQSAVNPQRSAVSSAAAVHRPPSPSASA